MITRILFASAGVLTLAGCANVPRQAGFGDVEKMVADRGVDRVHWNQGTDADRQVQDHLRELLAAPLTADTATQVALLNNRRLQAKYEDLTVAQADVVQAGLLRNPVFDADVKLANGHGPNIELGVAMDFLNVLFIPARKKVAAADFERVKLDVAGAVLTLAGETRVAVYDLQAAQQTLDLQQTALLAADASADLAKRLHDAGNITDLVYATEQAAFEQAKLDVASAILDVTRKRQKLAVLIGANETAVWNVTPKLEDTPSTEPTTDDAKRQAAEKNLTLASRRAEIEASARSLGLSRSMGFTADGDMTLGAVAERDPDGVWGVGPSISVPLPLFDMGQPQVAKAAAEWRRARLRYDADVTQLRANVATAVAEVVVARQRVDALQKSILPLRKTITQQTQLQYNGMLVGPFQLLEARRAETDAGVQYVAALRDYWLARNALQTAINAPLSEDH